MSVFNSIQGTTLINWRIGLVGPTIYSGSADPTISPPTPLADGFRNGDLYIRADTGASTIWVRDGGTFSSVSTGATGGDFDADVTMGAAAQFLLDETAVAGAPALTFDGDSDTGIFQTNPDEISFSTDGISRFIIESDGTLASTTATYESLVLNDNDIPNRKYVEDTFVNIAGDSMTGDLTFIGTAQLFAADGSIADPGISFGNDTDNGFMLDTGLGVDSVGIVSGGALIGDFTPDGLQMRNGAQVIGDTGSAGTPSFSFTGELDTGIFSDGTVEQFGFSTGGTQRWLMNASGHFIPGAVATYDIGSTGVPIRNLYTDHTLAEFGAAGDPSYSFDSDTDTGMYRSAANEISFATDSTQRWSVNTSGHFIPGAVTTYDIGSTGVPIRNLYTDHTLAEFGAAGDPSFSFDGDGTTGMYRAASNRIGFSTGGTQRVLIDDTFFDVNVPVRASTADNATTPSYSWDGDTATGFFRSASEEIGISTGGTNRWFVRANGDIEPVANNTYDIGESGLRVATVFATTFDGTATAAQYSDLAERYSVCKCCAVEPGTVMIICDHEDHEICASGKRADDRVLGVISEAPGFMMNKDAGGDDTHPYIALRGRVPVKVTGDVKKGDLLITSSTPGRAETASIDNKRFNHCAIFAKALSSANNGMVEAVIL